jgi:alpha-D-ribose 1-methylphosphonate 5-triphosphate synthase subunit PhnH
MSAGAVARGFADPVLDSQSVFRSVMMALANPGTIFGLAIGQLLPPAPLTPELAAIALALCDHETPVWLDRRLSAEAEVAAFIKFQTGAPLADDPAKGGFAFALDMDGLPPLSSFAQGTDDYPDRSTTLVLAVEALGSGRNAGLTGPGIKERAALALAPLTDAFLAELAGNHARFPRGVDCVFVAGGRVAALPRSTHVARGEEGLPGLAGGEPKDGLRPDREANKARGEEGPPGLAGGEPADRLGPDREANKMKDA